MSSLGGAGIGAGLYAVVSNPAQVGAVPEDAKEKRHHLKGGKGFINPWNSYVDIPVFELVVKGMFWYVNITAEKLNREGLTRRFV